jgi:hypothetical protein
VTDLFAGRGVSPAVTGVKNFIAEIVHIFIATGEDDGVCAFSPAAGDARDPWPVHARPGEFDARDETTPFRVPWNVTKDPFCH